MNERYSKLSDIQTVNYGNDCPVMFEAGALLKDNKLNKVLVQLKFLNAGDKTIKSVGLLIKIFDEEQNPLYSDVFYQYTELNVQTNELFGADTPIVLPIEKDCNVEIEIMEVVLSDNSIWHSKAEKDVEEKYNNNELITNNVRKTKNIFKIVGIGIVGAIIFGLLFLFAYKTIFKPTAFEYLKTLCINDGQNNAFLISEYNSDSNDFFMKYIVRYDGETNSLDLIILSGDYEATNDFIITIPNSLSGQYNAGFEYRYPKFGVYYSGVYKISASEFTKNVNLKPFVTKGDWKDDDNNNDIYKSYLIMILKEVYSELLEPNGYDYSDLGFVALNESLN